MRVCPHIGSSFIALSYHIQFYSHIKLMFSFHLMCFSSPVPYALSCSPIFSSPVRRTESYSDTPGVSVKMLKFLVQVIFSFLMFLSTTLFFIRPIYIYRGILCDTGRPSVRPSVCLCLSVCLSVRPSVRSCPHSNSQSFQLSRFIFGT